MDHQKLNFKYILYLTEGKQSYGIKMLPVHHSLQLLKHLNDFTKLCIKTLPLGIMPY